jgi:foldase protein PrsA
MTNSDLVCLDFRAAKRGWGYPVLGTILSVVALAACGGGIPSDAVVDVGGRPITRATFEHWMSVAAFSSAAAPAGSTGARPIVPEPPAYTACIAHLGATAGNAAKERPRLTAAQLKSRCEQQYKALQQQVLGFLISSEWVLGEAESQGVTVSDQQVKSDFEQVKSEQFPKGAGFKQYLASSHLTIADLLLRVKVNLLSLKLQHKVAKATRTIKQQQAALSSFVKEFKSKWTAETDCRPGYVVADCVGYKPS